MEGYRDGIRRWGRAFEAVFDRVEEPGSQEEKVTMSLLKIHSNLNHIQLEGTFILQETGYDAFLPEYTAIVETQNSCTLTWLPRLRVQVGSTISLLASCTHYPPPDFVVETGRFVGGQLIYCKEVRTGKECGILILLVALRAG